MSQTLYLLRHCATTGQEPDAPLTQEGIQQATLLADYFNTKNIDAIFSSPYARAYQSILPFAIQQNLSIQTDVRLIERVLCPEPILDWKDHLEITFVDMDYCLQGGETSRAATARIVDAVEAILQDQSLDTVLIVSHGNLLTLLLKHFDPTFGFSEWQSMKTPDLFHMQFSIGSNPTITHVSSLKD